MNTDLSVLRDPSSQLPLIGNGDMLTCDGSEYPIVSNIPRFVPLKNYASDFGLQWNRFFRTQLDSFSGCSISTNRLTRCLRGHLASIGGKTVLEAGSGAGRFTEILLNFGAEVHSFDYSTAVEANSRNNAHADRLTLVQADIRAIPFQKASYDYVICLGVLQHTPSPEESILRLWEMVRPGGYLAIDHYGRNWKNRLPFPLGYAEPLYRRFILSLSPEKRLSTITKIVDFWFPIHWKFRDSVTMQRILCRVSPVHFYYPELPLKDRERFYEWALLDTHDGTTDFYKHRRSEREIRDCLVALGAVDVLVTGGGNGVEAFCKKPE